MKSIYQHIFAELKYMLYWTLGIDDDPEYLSSLQPIVKIKKKIRRNSK